jgi:hypothetical protein
LWKYLLVFFDDILIYNKTWDEHLAHLEEVLNIMQVQSLYAKESKCKFGMRELLYLGHIINKQGLQVHQEKIKAIMDWPIPKNITELKGFFGLCSYYRVRKGVFIVESATHRSDEEGCFSVDRGITSHLRENEGGYEHMPYSIPSRFFISFFSRV